MSPTTPRGATAFYLVSVASMVVSVNTSWRYFGDVLQITNIAERATMFAVLELALIACGIGMRAGVNSESGRPGPARFVAWSLCALSAFMAWQIAGPLAGSARVLLGPVLGLVMLHLALGIEWRAHESHRAGTWSRIAHELRERVLSRVGLADDQRDALTRTRHRAADRAARLSVARHAILRDRRLGRALAAAGVAHDDTLRDRMLSARAVLANVSALRDLSQAAPWTGDSVSPIGDDSAAVVARIEDADDDPATWSADTWTGPTGIAATGSDVAPAPRPMVRRGRARTENRRHAPLTSGKQTANRRGPLQSVNTEGALTAAVSPVVAGPATQTALIRALVASGDSDSDSVLSAVRQQFGDNVNRRSVVTALRRAVVAQQRADDNVSRGTYL
jgi:hypothetical protein